MSNTLNNIYNNVSLSLYRYGEKMSRLQEQASTGSRINRASDDPSNAYNVLTINSEQKSLEGYIENLSEVMSYLEISSSVIGQMQPALTEAEKTITQLSSGTYTEAGRQRAAEGINDLLEQVVSYANKEHMGQYIFGGDDSYSVPYEVERTDGQVTRVTYQGSQQTRDIGVAPGVQMHNCYVGDELFGCNERGEPVFTGGTGAKAGTGTSNVHGDVMLKVINDGTNYKVSIDDGASYVTVPVGGQANQAVTDSRTGEVLYVDTTGINATGDELVQMTGSYDIFELLIGIRDVLKNEEGFSNDKVCDLLQEKLGPLDDVRNLVVQGEVEVGSKINFLDGLKNDLEDLKLNLEEEGTHLQEADISQVAIDLSRYGILYQMSLAAAGKMMSMSIFDYI